MSYNLKSETEVKEYITNLGIEYRFGCYSEKDPEVCHLLGDYLEAIDKDYQKAAKVYRSNCDDYKYPRSCYKFGAYSLLGRGTNQDYKEACKYFDKGCELNNPESCFHQGLMLSAHHNAEGVPPNVLKGMSLLEKACMLKNTNACYYLSGMYIKGVRKPEAQSKLQSETKESDYAVKKDMRQGHKYALEACNLGNIYSCANLSRMYTKGEGVEKNQELAEKYKKIALEMQEEMQSQKTLTFGQGLDNK